MKILVVEDDTALREGLDDLLRNAGHEVVGVADGDAALAAGVDPEIGLLLLDLTLPGLDGIEVCRRLRSRRPQVSILILTARGSEDDKVMGLEAGADDYVTKPFGTRELLARVEAQARRSSADSGNRRRFDVDGCTIDLGRYTAMRDGTTRALTAKEAEILAWLYRHRSRAVRRSELLEHVWGHSAEMETRTVDMTIANLRQKIENEPKSPRIVVTVKGVGYAWGDP